MKIFLGREKEQEQLQELMLKKDASLVVLKGRRRVGKSRLAEEFAKKFEHAYFFSGLPPEAQKKSPQEQREDFASQIQQQLGIPKPRSDDWSDILWTLAEHTKRGKVLIVLDEISWMASNNTIFLRKLKTAWDLHFKKNPKLILIVAGSVSSWIEKNIISSTGFVGRISLYLDLEPLTLPYCNAFWRKHAERISAYEKLKVLSVTGGVPRYLEEVLPQKSAEENITRLCFRPAGLLVKEFKQIFSDLFERRNSIYEALVTALVDGPKSANQLAAAAETQKGGTISQYLSDLVQSGFISRHHTWDLLTGQQSKLSQYQLSDNYLRFYLKYIKPNLSMIERNLYSLPSTWQSIIGYQFEVLVLQNLHACLDILNIDIQNLVAAGPYFQTKTNRQAGCQVDLMIQDKFNTLYVCEIKFSKNPIDKPVVKEVQEKISRLKIPKGFSCRPVLIHVNGVSDSVIEADFFSHIIDFASLLK